jgi:peptide-methionine (S)-S-oxide reductase
MRKGFAMATSRAPRKRLPEHPSPEHLRKQAKRLARRETIALAAAQRRLAAEYGFRSWAALMRAMPERAAEAALSPLSAAAARGDTAEVARLLAAGAAADGEREIDAPLWHVCSSAAPDEARLAVARLLLDAGAAVRRDGRDNRTALQAAAARGPFAMVELLIRRGAVVWQVDARGRNALAYARRGRAADKAAIIEVLDWPVIRDPAFRRAVAAIHGGEVAALAALLDQDPDLLQRRALEPDWLPRGYFSDPKLFWFIANNPTLMKAMPANIVAIARTMLDRGVAQDDRDYALGLVMTSAPARQQGHQLPLLRALLAAGAVATPPAIAMTLGHRELEPVQALLDAGLALTAPIAAALGRVDDLGRLLARADAQEKQEALGQAVINRQIAAARLCLDAGADVNAFLPVHKHSTPLHQAALDDDLAMLTLLIERGARTDIRDTMWNGTPLGWAIHTRKRKAEAYLRALMPPSPGET